VAPPHPGAGQGRGACMHGPARRQVCDMHARGRSQVEVDTRGGGTSHHHAPPRMRCAQTAGCECGVRGRRINCSCSRISESTRTHAATACPPGYVLERSSRLAGSSGRANSKRHHKPSYRHGCIVLGTEPHSAASPCTAEQTEIRFNFWHRQGW
jgi:hypothetical protein